jgi:recombination protein RecT
MSALAQRTAEAAAQKTQPTIRDLVQAQQPAIEAQLAGAINSTAFVRAALSEIAKSEQLQQASVSSVLGSLMLAAQLKLEIGSALGHFYLTPRKDHGTWTCVPIVGYQGYIELAYRSGRVAKIETFLVRDRDRFEYGANSERGRFFDWEPADYDDTRPWTGAVVTAQLVNGGIVWAYMPRDKVLARRPFNWERGPWKSHEEEMARKTMVRELAPYLPKSTELARAIEADEQKVEQVAGVTDLVVTRGDMIVVDEAPAEDVPA